jgi:rhodanese-related sulfurtransferase
MRFRFISWTAAPFLVFMDYYHKKNRSIQIVNSIFIFCLIYSLLVFPNFAGASGWAGDGEADDDDTIWVGADGRALEDHTTPLDDPKFQTRLGNIYRKSEDYIQAIQWYRKAASKGFESAQNNLASMYEQGLGITKSDTLAAQWYRLAADQGNGKAQHSLGQMYLEGRGVPPDIDQASKWILKSAQKGHISAMKKIADMFWEGQGVLKSNIHTYEWWKLAVMHGEASSKKYLEMAKTTMDIKEIAKAEQSFAFAHIPDKKQTVLGLYLTAKTGYEKWEKNCDKIKIIDTRTIGEYLFVGHGSMAYNIPVKMLNLKSRSGPVMIQNENFVSDVRKKCKDTDTILLMCRSGVRSALAVNILAQAGFKKVYSIIDGFEGDKLKNFDSPSHGKRVINGWKNDNLPWTYDLKPGLIYSP